MSVPTDTTFVDPAVFAAHGFAALAVAAPFDSEETEAGSVGAKPERDASDDASAPLESATLRAASAVGFPGVALLSSPTSVDQNPCPSAKKGRVIGDNMLPLACDRTGSGGDSSSSTAAVLL
jgi:hypothetical protein